MAYLIRSHDGRFTLCVSDPDQAAERLVEMQLQGYGVEVRDINGVRHGVISLLQAAEGLAKVAGDAAFA